MCLLGGWSIVFIISKVSILPWERVSQSTTADFFLCSNWLQRNVKDRLIQANSTFAGKPHFHTQSRGQVFHKNTLGLAVPISHGCALSPRAKQTLGGSTVLCKQPGPSLSKQPVHPSSHCQGLAMWYWENTNKMWKRKIQKNSYTVGS